MHNDNVLLNAEEEWICFPTSAKIGAKKKNQDKKTKKRMQSTCEKRRRKAGGKTQSATGYTRDKRAILETSGEGKIPASSALEQFSSNLQSASQALKQSLAQDVLEMVETEEHEVEPPKETANDTEEPKSGDSYLDMTVLAFAQWV